MNCGRNLLDRECDHCGYIDASEGESFRHVELVPKSCHFGSFPGLSNTMNSNNTKLLA